MDRDEKFPLYLNKLFENKSISLVQAARKWGHCIVGVPFFSLVHTFISDWNCPFSVSFPPTLIFFKVTNCFFYMNMNCSIANIYWHFNVIKKFFFTSLNIYYSACIVYFVSNKSLGLQMTCCFPFVCGCWHLSFETRGFGKWHTNKYVMGLKREGYVMMQHSDDTGVHELSVVKAKCLVLHAPLLQSCCFLLDKPWVNGIVDIW